MRSITAFLLLVFISLLPLHAQQLAPQQAIESLQRIDPGRLGSGKLYLRAMDALREARMQQENGQAAVEAAAMRMLPVAVYAETVPDEAQLAQLQAMGVRVFPGYWTPPADNHPLGFFLAEMPAARLPELSGVTWIRKLGDAGGQSFPQNNEAARTIGADRAWFSGLTGKGVVVGVLDSGIDLTLPQTELPPAIAAKDYSLFPAIDDDVRNHITPHGTHVTGSILGRGVLSAENPRGSFRGMAPEADFVFFKIGNDTTANSEDIATIAALHDAVTVYNVDIISMSYGGWEAYHDGSSPEEQKADWCYDNGTAVFFAAGNSRQSGKHFSATVDAQSESDFIQVNYWVPENVPVRPSFNMVWYDGIGLQRPIALRYFDENKEEITDLNLAPVTESPRGTQSQYSSTVDTLAPGNVTRYLKIVNGSDQPQLVHLYEDMGEGSIWFSGADPKYTIVTPSSADRVMSVAAFTSRTSWLDYYGAVWSWGQKVGDIATFSSLGPRTDEVGKPDIAAPGSAIVSIRDRDMATNPSREWMDNDGVPGGEADYQIMHGTSMATPICAGAAALVLEKYPLLTPGELYDSLRAHARQDLFTGATPNTYWGSGKLDVGFLSNLPAPEAVWVKTVTALPTGSTPVAELLAHPAGSVFALTEDGHSSDPAIFRSSDGGAVWTQVLQNSALSGLTVLKDGTVMVIVPDSGKQYRSSDEGNAWTEAAIPVGATDPRRAFHDSLVLIGTPADGPHFSSDNGLTWNSAQGNLPDSSEVRCAEGGADGWIFAAVMKDGKYRMYRGHRANWNWELKDSAIVQSESVVDIRMLHDGTLIAATDSRVYRSSDNGEYWQDTAVINGTNRRLDVVGGQTALLANGSNAVHRSIDGGRSWELFDSGLERKDASDVEAAGGLGWCSAGSHVYYCAFPAVPAAVLLTAPVDSAANVGTSPELSWLPAENATAYRIQIGRDPALREVLLETQWDWTTNVRPAGLTADTVYFWRVRGVNPTGEGLWSDTWSFTTSGLLAVGELPNAAEFQILSIYPHPVKGTMRLQVQTDEARSFEIQVIDLLGRVVYTSASRGQNVGVAELSLSLPTIRAGWYVLRARSGSHSTQRMFLLMP
ncbi:MAG: S8 family serine peptidase [Bacteroidota bacterium]